MWGVGSIRGACGGWGALGVHVGGGGAYGGEGGQGMCTEFLSQ